MAKNRYRSSSLKGKRYQYNFRTTKELREKLDEAAWQSGRSLSQEVEFRLERSFWEEEVADHWWLKLFKKAGLVVVPREPTEAMTDAGRNAGMASLLDYAEDDADVARDTWRAMIDAALKKE